MFSNNNFLVNRIKKPMSDKEVKEVASEPEVEEEMTPLEDTSSSLWMGIQAMIACIWHILAFFIYIKTDAAHGGL